MKICCEMWKWKCYLQQWKTKKHKLIQKSLKPNTFYLTEQSALQVVSIWWGLVESFATFI